MEIIISKKITCERKGIHLQLAPYFFYVRDKKQTKKLNKLLINYICKIIHIYDMIDYSKLLFVGEHAMEETDKLVISMVILIKDRTDFHVKY